MSKPNVEDTNFMKGYAAVIACIIRTHDMPTMAKDIMESDGLDINSFEGNGIDEFDIKEIRKLVADKAKSK